MTALLLPHVEETIIRQEADEARLFSNAHLPIGHFVELTQTSLFHKAPG